MLRVLSGQQAAGSSKVTPSIVKPPIVLKAVVPKVARPKVDVFAKQHEHVADMLTQASKINNSKSFDMAASDVFEKAFGNFTRGGSKKPGDMPHVNQSNMSMAKLKRTETALKSASKLFGGKLPPGLKVLMDLEPRAFANRKRGLINVGNALGSIYHEVGHFIEDNPKYDKMSKDFLRRRTGVNNLNKTNSVRFNKFAGYKQYDSSERFFDDEFYNKYVGKDYSHQGVGFGTEIVSTGLEKLSDVNDALVFARQDPEHFQLIMRMIIDIRENGF